MISVEHDGMAFDVAVPSGVWPGTTFSVEYVPPQAVEPVEPPLEPEPLLLDDPVDSVLMAAVVERRLTPENAQALHDIMEALYDFDDLDEYIDEQKGSFWNYEKEGEQKLEWTSVHLQYVAMVEQCIHEHLQTLGTTPDGLYALLGDVAGSDERASNFLDRLLGMGDYDHFCKCMKAGGHNLKVSGLDLRKVSGGKQLDFAHALRSRFGVLGAVGGGLD